MRRLARQGAPLLALLRTPQGPVVLRAEPAEPPALPARPSKPRRRRRNTRLLLTPMQGVQFSLPGFGRPGAVLRVQGRPGRPRHVARPDGSPRRTAEAGERTCGSCMHCTELRTRPADKCELTRTPGTTTDIRATDRACARWAPRPSATANTDEAERRTSCN